MSLRFGESPSDDQSSARKPPPNYLSRRVQYRLMVMVATFMLVLILIFEAAKPENWRWLWGGDQAAAVPAQRADEPLGEARPDRVPMQPAPATGNGTAAEIPKRVGAVPADESALDRARRTAWQHVWRELEPAQRVLLWKLLYTDSLAAAPPAQQTPASDQDADTPENDLNVADWSVLVMQLNDAWTQYLSDSRQAVELAGDDLAEEQRQQWNALLDQLENEWRDDMRPALALRAFNQPLENTARNALQATRRALDQLAMLRVEDNAVFLSDDDEAWHRLLSILQDASVKQLAQAASQPASYLQLYDQPELYRGRLVAVRGTARMGYHLRARPNPLGIEGYYVLWIKPADGTSRPIAVYALQLPEGFPELPDRDVDRETATLNLDVEVPGYFFKRWAYQAHDGPSTAPLVLARAPRIIQVEAPVAVTPPAAPLRLLVMAAVVAGLLAVSVAATVYFRSRHLTRGNRFTAGTRDAGSGPAAFDIAGVKPSVSESLRQLSSRQTDATAPDPNSDSAARQQTPHDSPRNES